MVRVLCHFSLKCKNGRFSLKCKNNISIPENFLFGLSDQKYKKKKCVEFPADSDGIIFFRNSDKNIEIFRKNSNFWYFRLFPTFFIEISKKNLYHSNQHKILNNFAFYTFCLTTYKKLLGQTGRIGPFLNKQLFLYLNHYLLDYLYPFNSIF